MKASDKLETVWECSSPLYLTVHSINLKIRLLNTLWTGDADLRLYITTVQDG